jgi:hypothetical protein
MAKNQPFSKFLTKNNKSAAQSTVRQNKSGQKKLPSAKNNKDTKKENIVMAPTALSSQYKNAGPAFSYSQKGDGSIRVRHREYVRDITSTNTNYAVQSISINPGISTLFTWLCSIALSYESYLFNSLSFEFESSGVTTDRGTVMMGIDFDAADSPPTTKQQFMSIHGSTRSAVWSHQCCTASQKDLRKFGVQRYVRNSAPLGTQDIKTYDVGNFLIATQGTGNITCGELYVTYDVTLHTPQFSGLNTLYGYNAKITSSDNVTATQPMGTSFSTYVGGLSLEWRTTNSFNVKTIGQFIVTVLYTGSGLESTDPNALTCPTGGVLTSPYGVWMATVGGGEISAVYFLDVQQPGCYLQMSMNNCSPTFYAIRFAPYLTSLN